MINQRISTNAENEVASILDPAAQDHILGKISFYGWDYFIMCFSTVVFCKATDPLIVCTLNMLTTKPATTVGKKAVNPNITLTLLN